MEKIKNSFRILGHTQTITMLALFAALSIVLGKYLAITFLNSYRISLENLPIIIAAAAYGPVAGAIVGVIADLIGCLMVGYAINPIITAGAAAIGIVSGILGLIVQRRGYELPGRSVAIRAFTTVGIAHIIGSVIIKTIGIYIFYPQPFIVLISSRFAIYLFTAIVEGFILYILYRRKIINMFIPRTKK